VIEVRLVDWELENCAYDGSGSAFSMPQQPQGKREKVIGIPRFGN
jgi:hypothetical protein